MNNNRRWLKLALLSSLMFLPGICGAQIRQGPSGGYAGEPFDSWSNDKNGLEISEVRLNIHDSVIGCIRVLYRDSSGKFVGQTESGGDCRLQDNDLKDVPSWNRIELARDEFLIGIAGRYGTRIDSIRFFTNKRNIPSLGGSGGEVDFGYTATAGQMIVGFFGRASDNLDAIGVLYAPQKVIHYYPPNH